MEEVIVMFYFGDCFLCGRNPCRSHDSLICDACADLGQVAVRAIVTAALRRAQREFEEEERLALQEEGSELESR